MGSCALEADCHKLPASEIVPDGQPVQCSKRIRTPIRKRATLAASAAI